MQIPAPVLDPFRTASWREDAARIVEQLFPVTPSQGWNDLLDLREGLLRGNDWTATLNTFLACRKSLETDNYLPFFRLRRLLATSLRLETGLEATGLSVKPLAELLQTGHRSFADLKRAVRRQIFEHTLDLPAGDRIPLRLVERA